MATGYTREQLRELGILIDNNVPPEQSADQLETAAIASDVVMTGTEFGALVRIGFEHGETVDFFLNVAVVLELIAGLYGAAQEQNWWPHNEQPGAFEPELKDLKQPDLDNARRVLSLRTDSTPSGALISFSTGRTVSQFFMSKIIAHYVVAGLYAGAERGAWWTDELQIIPSDN